MIDRRCATGFGKFTGDDADFLLGRATGTHRFFKVSQRLNIEERADDRQEEVPEPDGFVQAQRLQKGFVEQRDGSHRTIIHRSIGA